MRVLLTESASLTARETLTVLGRDGIEVDLLSSGPFTLGRFSRWARRRWTVPAPALDPMGYLEAVGMLARRNDYAAVLPTHEQGWLLAAGAHLLLPGLPIALAPIAAFDRVQSKIAFARLLDELDLPQPRWWLPGAAPDDIPRTYWVKAALGTAGRGVTEVHSPDAAARAVAAFEADGQQVMCQAPAVGQYGQVQALFDHGRMIAAHTCVAVGEGVGGSAAARRSVDHPVPRDAARKLGAELDWHGGLTLDYLHVDGRPSFLECNPRTTEPANAAAAGVDLPRLTIALSRGEPLPEQCLVGRPGVRTHSSLALALGAAARTGRRRAVLRAMAAYGGPFGGTEILTPLRADPVSAIAYLAVTSLALLRPATSMSLASGTVGRYSVGAAAVDAVRGRSSAPENRRGDGFRGTLDG